MFKVEINKKKKFTIDFKSLTTGTIDNKEFDWDFQKSNSGNFHIIKNNKSYRADVISTSEKEKSFVIAINGNKYTVDVKDKFDELLHTLGMDNINSSVVNEIKAPMPGMVLDVRVTEGMQIKKGDAVVVLEAMKMENILKSPTDGIVKKINVKKGLAVEKNMVLINL